MESWMTRDIEERVKALSLPGEYWHRPYGRKKLEFPLANGDRMTANSGTGADGGTRMEVPQEEDVTVLLSRLTSGDQEAAEKIVPLVYEELKRLARSYMRRERQDHTLQPTALVNEAYLKLVRQESVKWQSRSHFIGIAAQLMRRVLIDHARGQLREKRGGAKEVLPLNEALVFSPEQSEELVKLDEALERLAAIDPRQSRVVELRFFGGLSGEEAAELLGVSLKTVKRDWSLAKAWLHGELRRGDGNAGGELGAR